MRRRIAAYVLFCVGVVLLLVHTTMPALWQILGLRGDYPLSATRGLMGASAGFTPPFGTALMLAAGFIYGGRRREDER